MKLRLTHGLACALVIMLTACGGSSDTNDPPPPDSPAAPSIAAQPTDAATSVGQTATFTVVAKGTDPLSYQWQKNATAISGATAASYTTPAVSMTDDGATFTVVVSNSAGTATSSAAKLTVSTGSVPPTAGTDVLTFKYDVSRSGQNLKETTLTAANVASSTFGLLHNITLDGKVDAQPLYLSQLTVASAVHNVVFVATENASVYAYDADSGTSLWQVSLLGTNENPSDMVLGCDQVSPQIGITSTPVIDRSAGPHGAIYIVAMSLDSQMNYHQRLHALDVTTGAELFGGPTEITASFPNASGTVTFDPRMYEERAALLLSKGTVYTTWTSHCDIGPYQGWIIAFSETTLARTGVLNVAPNSGGSGAQNQGPAIWMSGDGPGADPAGNVYLLTANGRFETSLDSGGFPNQGDYGNSFLRISNTGGTLAVGDYFTMYNEIAESTDDEDLGSGGELLLPDLTDSTGTVRHLVVGAGKDSNIYIVNRDSMGKFDSSTNNIWQQVNGALGGRIFSSPAYFNGTLYYGGVNATLRAFPITQAKLATSASSQSATSFGFPGTSPVVSANGTSNAIVWAHENGNTGALHAYDASNLAHELYNSNQASGNRDQFGAGNKFITPVVVGGKVFVGTTTGLAIFGLLH